MKRLIPILFMLLSMSGCKPTWVRELESKNPLKDSAQYTSVYFRFDTIINDFEVSGILYPAKYDDIPDLSAYNNGVRLFFHSLKAAKTVG